MFKLEQIIISILLFQLYCLFFRLNFEIISIDSVSGMTSTLIDFVNVSTTLTPSESWLEMVATHTSATEVLENIQVEIAGLTMGFSNGLAHSWRIQS